MNLTSLTYSGALKPAATMRQRVDRLERAMMAIPQADCPVRHFFLPGMAAREITIPAGVTLVGAEHLQDSIVVLSAGVLEIVTETGTETIRAPHTMICRAGTKNAAVALETAVWTNFWQTDETDVDGLVMQVAGMKASELLGGTDNKQLLANRAAEKEALCHSV